MKHFKLTSESIINVFGVKLFRLELIIDCKWGKIGEKGGWAEKEENIGDAWVSGNAQVSGDARVSGNARVYGDAQVYGNARVYGDAQVYGNAQVYGDARVSGNAWVYGDARVSGNAWVYGNAQVYGDAWEESPLQIQGTKHFFTVCAKWKIAIGCHIHTFEYWQENYKRIGAAEGYTEDQIKEYGLYIKLAVSRYKP